MWPLTSVWMEGSSIVITGVIKIHFLNSVTSLHFFQWRQADSIRHLGKVTLAQEPDYTGLIVGCVCVSLLLLGLGTLLMWRRNKHIDGKSRDVGSWRGSQGQRSVQSCSLHNCDILNPDSDRLALISQDFVTLSALICVHQMLQSGQVW